MKSLLARTYAFVFLNDFILIYPLYAVMFTDHGLSAAQVAAIMAVWSGVVFVLEIPSGVLADKFSRRHIMAFGQIIRAMGYAVWLFFPGFWGYLVGFLLWGIKSALTHGTFEAWLYDELKSEGKAETYAQVYSRVRGISFIAILAASGGAALGILLGYGFVLAMSIGGGVVAAGVALSLPAALRSEKDADEAKPYLELLKLGLKNAASDPVVLRIMILMAFTAGFIGTLDEFWPIYADMAGAPKWGVAIFVGFMSAVQGIAAFQAWRTEGWDNRTFYLLVVGGGMMLIVSGWALSLWALVFLATVSGIDAIVKVVFDARLQHRIGSETRATVSSVKGLITELFGLVSLGTFGFVAAGYGAQTSFIVVGAIIVIGGLIYWLQSFLTRRTHS